MQDTDSSVPEARSHADLTDLPAKRRPFVAADWQLFEYVESGQISPTAAFLYMVLLKHRPSKRTDKRVWPSRETLAEALKLSRPESVDPYLRQLRDAGLVSWEPWRIGGMRARNRYTLHLVADLKSESKTPGSSVPLKTAQRTPVQRASDTPWTEDELEQGELPQDELDPKEDSYSTAPPTFASLSSAVDAELASRSDESWAVKNVKDVDRNEPREDYRREDRALFQSFVGDKIRTYGSTWGEDGQVFTAEGFYKAFRLRGVKRKPIEWPGKFLQKLQDDGLEIEDWLTYQGLESVP